MWIGLKLPNGGVQKPVGDVTGFTFSCNMNVFCCGIKV